MSVQPQLADCEMSQSKIHIRVHNSCRSHLVEYFQLIAPANLETDDVGELLRCTTMMWWLLYCVCVCLCFSSSLVFALWWRHADDVNDISESVFDLLGCRLLTIEFVLILSFTFTVKIVPGMTYNVFGGTLNPYSNYLSLFPVPFGPLAMWLLNSQSGRQSAVMLSSYIGGIQ